MAKPRLRNMSFICSLAPAISQRAPLGSSGFARAVSTSVLVWPTLLETAAAEMVTVRSPSTCVIWAGPAASSTVATLDRGTGPAQITHVDGERTVTISAAAVSSNVGQTSTDVETALADLELPDGAR